ncbi:eukaryotic aspartyl protease family protein [Medicago truncatula]|uniref:Eukaryotic aspartyl protease family protein n=1 Tax=Medicago truncatula TaxID=3880 RepID=A0A072VVE6_MEDTR|nr:eukaryotic aspartyl protease family protein [Medicago truncatula]
MSPFYNPSLSKLDLIRNVAFRSNTRLNRFSHSLSLLSNENYKSIILPNNGDYLMRIFIGTPPIEKLAIFDPDTPLYDRTKSSAHTNLTCDTQSCTLLPKKQQFCGKSQECFYSYHYGDKSFSVSELVVDSISFGSNSVHITFPKSIFGCGYYNIFTADNSGKAAGLVGLGAGPFSLVSQLGHSIGRKFSYCLVPFGSNSTSKLKFGNQSTITGNEVVSTPLIIKSLEQTFYYLNLEGITIGRQKTIQTGQIDGNIIIDSGTALMYLEQPFFDDFLASVKEVIDIEEVEDIPSPFHYCFEDPNSSFPSIVLHFTGANVPLQPKNILYLEENNLVCLAVVPSNIAGISILGNLAQIDFQVEYDLEGKKLSFSPSDCTKN